MEIFVNGKSHILSVTDDGEPPTVSYEDVASLYT